MARGQPAAALVRDEPAIRDGQQGVVSVEIVGLGEEGLVRGDDRQAAAVGKPQQLALHEILVVEAVAQDLDIEVVLAEGLPELIEPGGGEFRPPLPQGRVEGPGRAAGERDQAGGRVRQRRGGDAGRLAERPVEIGPARQPQQVAVADLVLGQHHDVGARDLSARQRVGRLEGHRQLQPGDRLNAGARGLLGEFEGAEQVVGVGERQGGLPVGSRGLHDVTDLQGAFEQRVGRVNVEVDESDLLELTTHDRP
ncbi:hypothetical protein AEGHOMDF_4227 [Methylobacterium soli]|nr:hypothetical protein AEGHOMDF_4227 [Methylobacterium soli]